jgi:uncharacterized membrane protein YeaQ/YmgE (transglycosylase-associated protein family)
MPRQYSATRGQSSTGAGRKSQNESVKIFFRDSFACKNIESIEQWGEIIMLNLLGIIVSGLIVGILARFFYPGEVPMGWIASILLGIGGSVLAGLVVTKGRLQDGIGQTGWIASILGAMALILIVRVLS